MRKQSRGRLIVAESSVMVARGAGGCGLGTKGEGIKY